MTQGCCRSCSLSLSDGYRVDARQWRSSMLLTSNQLARLRGVGESRMSVGIIIVGTSPPHGQQTIYDSPN